MPEGNVLRSDLLSHVLGDVVLHYVPMETQWVWLEFP